jgi:hypothetical protein
MRILACSDIHLGRIPAVLGYPNLSGHSAWEAIVQKAVDLKVEALVLAGDVVEKDNAWFEAYGPLLKGLEKLHDANIEVFAVAGNHDAKVFPRLAKEGKHIHMLGLGEKWESIDYKGVRFVGWSFKGNAYRDNPFDSYDTSLKDFPGARLGILHCDVDSQIGGMYASVPSSQFPLSGVPLWVLGHIHAKRQVGNNLGFYCGSPYALDSSETGDHGVYLLETMGENSWKEPVFLSLSPWQFCDCEVNLEGIASTDDLMSYIGNALRDIGKEKVEEGYLGDMYCRLVFVGTVPTDFDLQAALPPEGLESLDIPNENGASIRVQSSFVDNTEFVVDLESLSKGVGPIALLAKQLLDTESLPGLLDEAQALVQKSYAVSSFMMLQRESAENVEDLVRKASMALLRTLLRDRGAV